MANIAASDITVTILNRRTMDSGRKSVNAKLAFGNGALTYPAGGVPISLAALGCPNTIESLYIYDDGVSGYKWTYDAVNMKLVAVRQGAQSASATHSHNLLVKGGQIGSTTNDIAHYATDILGKEAATDATITGAASATKGGVLSDTTTASVTAAVFAEPSTVAIAAQTLKCEVIGW